MTYTRPGVSTNKKTIPFSNIALGAYRNVGLIATAGSDGTIETDYDIVRSASGADDFVSNVLTAAEVVYEGYRYTKDTDFAIKTGGYIEWKNTTISVPYLKSLSAEDSANELNIGTYFYKITAIKMTAGGASPVYGETTVSNELSITLSEEKAVRLRWAEVSQADGYKIYRGTATDAEQLIFTVVGETTTFLDDGVYVASGAMPTTNTAYRKPAASIAATSGEWVGDTASGNLATIQGVSDGDLTYSLDGSASKIMAGIDFSAVAATGADLAGVIQYHFQRSTGTAGYTKSGDLSLNLTNLNAVTDGKLMIKSDNLWPNGDFGLDDLYWTAGVGWTITTGQATAATSSATLVHSATVSNSTTYYVTFTVSEVSAGNVTVAIGGVTGGAAIVADGTYTREITTTGTTDLTFTATGFSGVISDVQVRTAATTAAIDLSSFDTINDIATEIQSAIRTATSGTETVTYDSNTGEMTITSDITGTDSLMAVLTPATGTDLTAETLLNFNQTSPYNVRGTNTAATFTYDTDHFEATSPTTGTDSSITFAATVGGAGTDLYGSSYLVFNTGTGTSGTAAENVTYDVTATETAGNFFVPAIYFTTNEVATAFGEDSEIFDLADKAFNTWGTKQLTLCAIPEMNRSSAQAALNEMGQVDMDLITIATDDADIGRDLKAHCELYSNVFNKRERYGLHMVRSSAKIANIVAYASELSSERFSVVFDNYSTENYPAFMVAAQIGSLATVSDSVIERQLTVDSLLEEGRISTSSATYLGSQNVMVLDKNKSGTFVVIDDLLTNGEDATGVVSDDNLRKGLRLNFRQFVGKKITTSLVDAISDATDLFLERQAEAGVIDSYGFTTISVVRSTADLEKLVVRFTYTRVRTLKRIEFQYYVI